MFRILIGAATGWVTLAVLATATASSGAEYFIQIGAFKYPQDSFAHPASSFGEVTAIRTDSGLTLYRLGPFASRRQALQRLGKVRAAGYPDAFVSMGGGADTPAQSKDRPRLTAERQAALLASLPREVRAKLIYVNGSLHVREGGRFIPVEQYAP